MFLNLWTTEVFKFVYYLINTDNNNVTLNEYNAGLRFNLNNI